MKNIFQFENYIPIWFVLHKILKTIYYKGNFILVKQNLVLYYNVIIINIFFPLTCLIKLGITGTLNMQRCREKNYYYSSGSRCNKLIFALPRKIKSWATWSRTLQKRTRRLLYLPTIPENMKYLNYIFEMFRNSGNLVRGILHCQGFF